MLLLPLIGICQQRETKDAMSGYYDLKLDDVMNFLSKDSVDKSEVMRDLNVLNAILSKDIGEEAMIKEISALDRVRDSVAFYNLVTTKWIFVLLELFFQQHRQVYFRFIVFSQCPDGIIILHKWI